MVWPISKSGCHDPERAGFLRKYLQQIDWIDRGVVLTETDSTYSYIRTRLGSYVRIRDAVSESDWEIWRSLSPQAINDQSQVVGRGRWWIDMEEDQPTWEWRPVRISPVVWNPDPDNPESVVAVHATWDYFDELIVQDLTEHISQEVLAQYADSYAAIWPTAINAIGDVVGHIIMPDDERRVFYLPANGAWQFGDLRVYPRLYPEYSQASVSGVNIFGEVTGTTNPRNASYDTPRRAFLFRLNGEMFELGTLRNNNTGHSYGSRINGQGEVVGCSQGQGWKNMYGFR